MLLLRLQRPLLLLPLLLRVRLLLLPVLLPLLLLLKLLLLKLVLIPKVLRMLTSDDTMRSSACDAAVSGAILGGSRVMAGSDRLTSRSERTGGKAFVVLHAE